jgi:IS4 transposase
MSIAEMVLGDRSFHRRARWGMTTVALDRIRLIGPSDDWHFGFAVLLYNAWLMVDFLVQVGLDKEFRSKPRITADRFRSYIQRRLTRLI